MAEQTSKLKRGLSDSAIAVTVACAVSSVFVLVLGYIFNGAF